MNGSLFPLILCILASLDSTITESMEGYHPRGCQNYSDISQFRGHKYYARSTEWLVLWAITLRNGPNGTQWTYASCNQHQ